MKSLMYKAALVALVVALPLMAADAAVGAERKTVDIFADGKLAPGVRLENGRLVGKEIQTVSLGADGWGKPVFRMLGLDIDISEVDLAQIHVRVIAGGRQVNKPGYGEVRLLTAKGPTLQIKDFPFKSWQDELPGYMMESADRSNAYIKHPKGADYGRITGLAIYTSGGFEMRIRQVQILIDKSMADRYPDDPKPDPAWEDGSIAEVFAIPVSERVFQNELDSPLRKGSAVWDGRKVTLAGARNETVAFQVIMQTANGRDGVNDVDVKFTGLSSGEARIDNTKCAEPDNPYHFVGRYLQLYRTRYVLYDRYDRKAAAAKAAGVLGKMVPEIQIPFEAKWGGAPFPIFPGKSQGIWVDVYIPNNAPAGLYGGEVQVQVAGRTVRALPVELTVHDFALPNEAATPGLMFGTVPVKHGAKTPEELFALEKTYRQFFRRHHSGFFRGFEKKIIEDPSEWLLRSGSIYTREAGYEGPGESLPTSVIFIEMYGGGLKPFGGPGVSGTQDDWHRGLLKYKNQMDRYAKGALVAYYVWDEPGHHFKGGLPAFNKWFNTVVAPYVLSFNEKYATDIKLYASVSFDQAKDVPELDIYRAKTREEALAMEREGDINCAWNGPQGLGHFASALRVVGWKAHHLRTRFWWMWHATKYDPSFDVYRDAYNFRNQYGEEGAGTGMFVYPGTDVYVTQRSPGLKGPVPGTRFFNWRQGFIDAQYCALAAEKDPEAVEKIVAKIVSDAVLNTGLPGETASVGYPIGDAHYAEAREKLVRIILGK